jgi:hypothetical protein
VKKLNWPFVIHELCIALREVAVLWFVFSVLDKLLTDQLTRTWLLGNTAGSVMLWAVVTLWEARSHADELVGRTTE